MEYGKGRKYDYLIEDFYAQTNDGSFVKLPNVLTVWAKNGIVEELEKVEGVYMVVQDYETQYAIYIDHRYDVEYVKDEIEAVIQNYLDKKKDRW